MVFNRNRLLVLFILIVFSIIYLLLNKNFLNNTFDIIFYNQEVELNKITINKYMDYKVAVLKVMEMNNKKYDNIRIYKKKYEFLNISHDINSIFIIQYNYWNHGSVNFTKYYIPIIQLENFLDSFYFFNSSAILEKFKDYKK